jgi:hypothetical protein
VSEGTPEGGLNTQQFGVLFGTETYIAKEVLDADPYEKDGVGIELWDRLLERCTYDPPVFYFCILIFAVVAGLPRRHYTC